MRFADAFTGSLTYPPANCWADLPLPRPRGHRRRVDLAGPSAEVDRFDRCDRSRRTQSEGARVRSTVSPGWSRPRGRPPRATALGRRGGCERRIVALQKDRPAGSGRRTSSTRDAEDPRRHPGREQEGLSRRPHRSRRQCRDQACWARVRTPRFRSRPDAPMRRRSRPTCASFGPLEPTADGFRNFLKGKHKMADRKRFSSTRRSC